MSLEQIKKNLGDRLDVLSGLLKISAGSPLPNDHRARNLLNEFQQKSGFAKYWFYFRHTRTLNAVSEYLALSDLMQHAEEAVLRQNKKQTEQEQALLSFFDDSKLDAQQQIAQFLTGEIKTFSPDFIRLQNELRTRDVSIEDKFYAIRHFLSGYQLRLKQSKNIKANLIALYMNEELPRIKGLGYVKDEEISDFFSQYLEPTSLIEPNFQAQAMGFDIKTKKQLTFTWSLFGIIPFSHMNKVETRVEAQRKALDDFLESNRRTVLRNESNMATRLSTAATLLKAHLKNFFDSFIEVCKDCIESSLKPPPERRPTPKAVPEPEPSPAPVSLIQQAIDYLNPAAPQQDIFTLPGNAAPVATSSPTWFAWAFGNKGSDLGVKSASTPALK